MLLLNQPLKADYCVRIDFEKKSIKPERVFRTMSDLISSFQEFDTAAASSIDSKIEPILMLEDIEVGSLRTWLSNSLKKVPDDAIKALDWKQIVGAYLVRGKYILINWLDGKTQITGPEEIIDIQAEIFDAARETGVSKLDSYAPIRPRSIIKSISKIQTAMSNLQNPDSAEFISSYGTAKFNLDLNISPENLEQLITREKVESESTMILKVKKPDYLGDSMWEFYYDHVIDVKILDYDWLSKFQQRLIDVRPGDSIRAKVKTTISYGYDLTVIAKHYELIKVIEVIPNIQSGNQTSFLE